VVPRPWTASVVDGASNRKFLGVVTQRDLLAAFDSEILQRNRLVTPCARSARKTPKWTCSSCRRAPLVELEAPAGLVGKTIAEAGFGRGSACPSWRQAHGAGRRAPVRSGGDRTGSSTAMFLVVLGSEASIAKLHDEARVFAERAARIGPAGFAVAPPVLS
jgi:hypothetical protein